MKIVLLSIMYPPDTGGAETYAYELSRALAEHGHEVDVYAATSEPIPEDLALPEGVTVERLFERKKIPVFETLYYSLRVRLAIDFQEYDVVHGTMMPASTVLLRPGIGTPDVPLVVTSHGTSLGEFRSHDPDSLDDYGLKYLLHPANVGMDWVAGRFADRVIAISDHAAEELRETYGLDGKVEMIPHGVDTDQFYPREGIHPAVDEDRFTVLTVGRLGPRKNIGLAIRGVAEAVRKYDVDAEFLIAGTGRHEEKLRTVAREEGIKNRVQFLRYVDDEELPLLYSSADVFSLTSHYEGFGLVLLEAMACGTPVIGTDVGGIPTVIEDEKTGYLIPREKYAFAERLHRFNDKSILNVMSDKAKSEASAMDWENISKRCNELYSHTS